jgi:hypothetical protein
MVLCVKGLGTVSMARIRYVVLAYENLKQGGATPFLAVTKNP